MKENKSENQIKWKTIYSKYKDRKLNEIVDVKNKKAELIADPKHVLLKNKYIIMIAVALVIIALLVVMYKELNTFFITLAFLAGVCLLTIMLNTFKLTCNPDGMLVQFGLQKANLPYKKIKSIYLSKYGDYTFLHLGINYNIVIKYEDNNGFIKDLSFSTLFVNKAELDSFLDNLIVTDTNSKQILKFEKLKIAKYIAKIILFIAVVVFCIYYAIA